MKRILVSLFTLMIILTGCAQDNSTASGEMIATDDLGRKVSYSPDRVYADMYIGELMYLEANLVGADMTRISNTWPQENINSITNTGGDLEQVASLTPTLIITDNQDLVDQYEMIAPTYYLQYGKEDPIKTLLKIANILGLNNKMSTIEKQFNQAIDTLKNEIDQSDLTYTIIEPSDDGYYLMGDNWARGGFILYDYLNLNGTPQGEADYIRNDPSYLFVDQEQLLNYIGDVAIVVTDEAKPVTDPNNLYAETNAVKNNNVYYMDINYGKFDDPYALTKQLQFFQQMLSGDL